MTTTIQKKGNSLLVTIPHAIAKKAKLNAKSKIVMEYKDQKIIIFPQKKKEPTLKEMVSKINKDNLNVLEDDYVLVGREVW